MKTQEASSIERIPSAAMKASILLVDDRPANLLALEAILDSLDQHLVRATSGEEALEKLQEQEFAVILMDVRMPGMDGLRTAEVISQRESAARVPIIFLTAVPIANADVVSGYARGAVDFLLKPFDPEILRSKVSVFVDLYQKEQMIRRQAGLLRQRDREAFERRSELRFRSLMDALPQCVWVARSDLTFYYWNKRAVDYIGLPASVAVSAERLFEFVHPDDLATIRSEWQAGHQPATLGRGPGSPAAPCRRRVPMVPDARSSAARRIGKNNRLDRRRYRHRYGASGVGRSRGRQPHEGGIPRDGVA